MSVCVSQSAVLHEFIEEVLQPHFGGMIAFVKDCEVAVERGNMEHVKAQESKSVSAVLHRASIDCKQMSCDRTGQSCS